MYLKTVDKIIIINPKIPELINECLIDFGTVFFGLFVSSDISAAASNPVKHHAPNKIDNAKDLMLKSGSL